MRLFPEVFQILVLSFMGNPPNGGRKLKQQQKPVMRFPTLY